MLANYAPGHRPRLEPYLRCVTGPLVNAGGAGVARRLPDLGVALLLLGVTVLACRGLGRPLVRWIAPGRGGPGRDWLGLVIGLGALPLPHLGAGLLGFHTPGGLGVVLAGFAAAGLRTAARRRVRESSATPIPPDPLVRGALALAVIAAGWTQVAALIAGFAPAQVSDEFVLHLGVPGWWGAHHRIVPQPGNVFSAFPAGASLLAAPWVAAGQAFGTGWVHALAGWLFAGGVWLLLRDRTPVLRILATLGALTVPSVWIFAGRAYADLFPAALGVAALVALRNGRPGLAGVAIGLAVGTKYQAWLLLPMLLALVRLPRWPALLAGTALAAAPWLARNWLAHGDPVHPLLWRWFGQPGWDAVLAARVARGLHQDAAWSGLLHLPSLPWLIPVRTFAAGPDGTTGILAAVLVPALWFAPRPREALALLAVAVAAAVTGSGIRFLFPALGLLVVVAARGWDRAAAALPRRTAACTAALLVAWQAGELVPAGWRGFDDPLPVALGTETVSAYRERTAYPREDFPPGWFRLGVPPGARGRVLLAGSWGGAPPLGRPAYLTPLFDRPLPVILARGAADPRRIAVRFRQAGIGMVCVSRWRGEIYFDNWRCWDWSARELEAWSGFWDRSAVPAGPAAVQADWSAITRAPIRQPHRVTPGFEQEALRLVVMLALWNRTAEGESVLAKLSGLFPGNPEYHAARALVARVLDRPAEAREAAAKAIGLAPRSAAAARARAEWAQAEGRLGDAAGALRQAGDRDPTDAFVWLELSVLCHRLGRPADAWYAEREYRRAKSGGPEW